MNDQYDPLMERALDFARGEPRIRLVTLEGSRANGNVPRDNLQDHDLSFFVTDREHFQRDEQWLRTFGQLLMMQKPEDMELPRRSGDRLLLPPAAG